VPPPPRLSCNKKLSAPRFGNSNLPLAVNDAFEVLLHAFAVTSRTRIG
jgi:hypothetical protein